MTEVESSGDEVALTINEAQRRPKGDEEVKVWSKDFSTRDFCPSNYPAMTGLAKKTSDTDHF